MEGIVISVVWNAIKILHKHVVKRRALHLEIYEVNQIIAQGNFSSTSQLICGKILNSSQRKIFVERPRIKLDKSVNGKHIVQVITIADMRNFPIVLEPGESLEYPMSRKAFDEGLSSIKKVKLVVRDSLDNVYTSGSLALK